VSFLTLAGLEKTYPDGTHAVRGIDLAMEEGEFVVLLGPSGCGKTTTLRMIAGLEAPTGGKIHLAGRDVTELMPSQRDVGFVFQFYALYPHMCVRDNIAFPLRCAGVSRAEQDQAISKVAERLELTSLLGRRPRELSGGDQQRVALARAMVRRPAVYLMDEPLGTLDADRRIAMCEFLRSQQIELGVTTVYVTHDQEEALRLADRIVVMSEGKILQAGPPSEVYDDPANLFVARFVGSPGMNFVEGVVREENGDSTFFPREAQNVHISLPAGVRPGPATLGVRPEFVRVGKSDDGGPIAGWVIADEYLGASRCLHLDSPFGRLIARVSPEEETRESLEVTFDTEHIRMFDPDTGERIR
jgi:multiple sugar transport system ATP-binding protein